MNINNKYFASVHFGTPIFGEIIQNYGDGWALAKTYSQACPQGQMVEVILNKTWNIDPQSFQAAQHNNWVLLQVLN